MQVKVWNDNTYPYKELFRDQKIEIPPKSYILMEEGEAHLFKGTFSAPILDGDGNDTPAGYKMIRIEKVASEKPSTQVEELRCIACTYKPANKHDLESHIELHHKDQMVVDEEAEEAIREKRRR